MLFWRNETNMGILVATVVMHISGTWCFSEAPAIKDSHKWGVWFLIPMYKNSTHKSGINTWHSYCSQWHPVATDPWIEHPELKVYLVESPSKHPSCEGFCLKNKGTIFSLAFFCKWSALFWKVILKHSVKRSGLSIVAGPSPTLFS